MSGLFHYIKYKSFAQGLQAPVNENRFDDLPVSFQKPETTESSALAAPLEWVALSQS
jgi:hypothetical protein